MTEDTLSGFLPKEEEASCRSHLPSGNIRKQCLLQMFWQIEYAFGKITSVFEQIHAPTSVHTYQFELGKSWQDKRCSVDLGVIVLQFPLGCFLVSDSAGGNFNFGVLR